MASIDWLMSCTYFLVQFFGVFFFFLITRKTLNLNVSLSLQFEASLCCFWSFNLIATREEWVYHIFLEAHSCRPSLVLPIYCGKCYVSKLQDCWIPTKATGEDDTIIIIIIIIIKGEDTNLHRRRSSMQVMWEGSWECCTYTGWLPGTNKVPIRHNAALKIPLFFELLRERGLI